MRIVWFMLIVIFVVVTLLLWHSQARSETLDQAFEWTTTMDACEQKAVIVAKLKAHGAKPIFVSQAVGGYVMILTLPDGAWLQIAAPDNETLCVAFSGGEWTVP
jgi:hypothetical protein